MNRRITEEEKLAFFENKQVWTREEEQTLQNAICYLLHTNQELNQKSIQCYFKFLLNWNRGHHELDAKLASVLDLLPSKNTVAIFRVLNENALVAKQKQIKKIEEKLTIVEAEIAEFKQFV